MNPILSSGDWHGALDVHRFFAGINDAVIRNYRNVSPLEALELAIGPGGLIHDGVATVYALPETDDGFRLRLWKCGGPAEYYVDPATMPSGRGGFLGMAARLAEPALFDDLSSRVTDSDARTLPWIRNMTAALVVPTMSVSGEAAASIAFGRSASLFTSDVVLRDIFIIHSLTSIILNLLLRKEADRVNAALDEELATIGRIQRSLLPKEVPSTPGWEWAAHYATSARAGGDYYDFFAIDRDRVGILIADASGHGSPAAVVMAMTRTVLHSYDGEIAPPSEVLGRVNGLLCANNLPGHFVTAIYAVLDLKNASLISSAAGHPPPWISRRRGSLVRPAFSIGVPLGVIPRADFEEITVSIEPGDAVLFASDGLADSRNPAGEFFDEFRIESILTRDTSRSAEAVCAELVREIDQWRGSAPLTDDLTAVVARRKDQSE